MDAAVVLSLGFSVLALIGSAGSVLYARRSAGEARRANDLQEQRQREAARPTVSIEILGGPVHAELAVHNGGTRVIRELRVVVIGEDDMLSGTGFGSFDLSPGTAARTERDRVFSDLMPEVPQRASFWVLVEGSPANLALICHAATDDDVWSFRTLVDLPYDLSKSIY